MPKHRILTSILIAFLLPSVVNAAGSRVLDRGPDGTPRIIKGNLGTLGDTRGKSDRAVNDAAQNALQNILKRDFGATGKERIIPTKVNMD